VNEKGPSAAASQRSLSDAQSRPPTPSPEHEHRPNRAADWGIRTSMNSRSEDLRRLESAPTGRSPESCTARARRIRQSTTGSGIADRHVVCAKPAHGLQKVFGPRPAATMGLQRSCNEQRRSGRRRHRPGTVSAPFQTARGPPDRRQRLAAWSAAPRLQGPRDRDRPPEAATRLATTAARLRIEIASIAPSRTTPGFSQYAIVVHRAAGLADAAADDEVSRQGESRVG